MTTRRTETRRTKSIATRSVDESRLTKQVSRYRRRGGAFAETMGNDAFARLVRSARRRAERNECSDQQDRDGRHRRDAAIRDQVQVSHQQQLCRGLAALRDRQEHQGRPLCLRERGRSSGTTPPTRDKGKVKEAVRKKKRVDTFISADIIIADATNLKKVR